MAYFSGIRPGNYIVEADHDTMVVIESPTEMKLFEVVRGGDHSMQVVFGELYALLVDIDDDDLLYYRADHVGPHRNPSDSMMPRARKYLSMKGDFDIVRLAVPGPEGTIPPVRLHLLGARTGWTERTLVMRPLRLRAVERLSLGSSGAPPTGRLRVDITNQDGSELHVPDLQLQCLGPTVHGFVPLQVGDPIDLPPGT